jgi:hypothetical protein
MIDCARFVFSVGCRSISNTIAASILQQHPSAARASGFRQQADKSYISVTPTSAALPLKSYCVEIR